MTRYQKTFAKLKAENRAAFVPFWMLGDPNPAASLEIIRNVAKSADILELGLPFSDPLADGPTIQASVNRSLEAGTDTRQCLEIITKLRQDFPEKPIGLLVYLNLVLAYGINEFFRDCATAGVDSVLIPELPIEEISLVDNPAATNGIDLVFLVSTNTPTERVKAITARGGGFLYVVSTPSITGAKTDLSPETLALIKDLKKVADLPLCVGFGVSDPDQVQQLASAGADGVIIGSKLFEFMDAPNQLSNFCEDCRQSTVKL